MDLPRETLCRNCPQLAEDTPVVHGLAQETAGIISEIIRNYNNCREDYLDEVGDDIDLVTEGEEGFGAILSGDLAVAGELMEDRIFPDDDLSGEKVAYFACAKKLQGYRQCGLDPGIAY